MPIVIKELNIKVEVEDSKKMPNSIERYRLSDKEMARIVKKCVKQMKKELKLNSQR